MKIEPIITLGIVGVAGYFIYEKFFAAAPVAAAPASGAGSSLPAPLASPVQTSPTPANVVSATQINSPGPTQDYTPGPVQCIAGDTWDAMLNRCTPSTWVTGTPGTPAAYGTPVSAEFSPLGQAILQAAGIGPSAAQTQLGNMAWWNYFYGTLPGKSSPTDAQTAAMLAVLGTDPSTPINLADYLIALTQSGLSGFSNRVPAEWIHQVYA